MLLEMLDKKIKQIPVAIISQTKGRDSRKALSLGGKCWNEKTKLIQVITPRIKPSIIAEPQ